MKPDFCPSEERQDPDVRTQPTLIKAGDLYGGSLTGEHPKMPERTRRDPAEPPQNPTTIQ